MPRQVVLLRGINLAGKRTVGMPALRALLGEAGYENVETYVQSGNVVLTSRMSPAKLEPELERLLAERLGFDVDVFARTRAELATVVEHDPLGNVADNPSRYQVTFLKAKPSAGVVKELTGADVAPEQVVVHGREIYAWHPNGIGRSPPRSCSPSRSSASARRRATGRRCSSCSRSRTTSAQRAAATSPVSSAKKSATSARSATSRHDGRASSSSSPYARVYKRESRTAATPRSACPRTSRPKPCRSWSDATGSA